MSLNLYYGLASRESMKIELFLSFAKININLIQSSGVEGKYQGVQHILQTPHGDLFDPVAIIKYLARETYTDKSENHLYGDNSFEQSLVDQWTHYYSKELSPVLQQLYAVILCEKTVGKSKYHHLTYQVKHVLEHIDAKLKLDSFICGNFLSLADLNLIADLQLGYRLLFTEKYRKTIPYLTKWYQKISKRQQFQGVYGPDWICQKQLIPENFLPQEVASSITLPQSFNNILHPIQMSTSFVSIEDVKSHKQSHTRRNNLAYQYFKRLLKGSDKDKKQKMNILWQTFQLLDCSFWKIESNKNLQDNTNEELEKQISAIIQKCSSYTTNGQDYGFLALYETEGHRQIKGSFCFSGLNQPQWLKEVQDLKEFQITILDPIKNDKDKVVLQTIWSNNNNSGSSDERQKTIFLKMTK